MHDYVVTEGGAPSPCVPTICPGPRSSLPVWDCWRACEGRVNLHVTNGPGAWDRGGLCLYFFMYGWMNVCIHHRPSEEYLTMGCELQSSADRQMDRGTHAGTSPSPKQRSLTGTVIHNGSHYCWNRDPQKLTRRNVQAVSRRQNEAFQWSLHRSQRVSGFGDVWRESVCVCGGGGGGGCGTKGSRHIVWICNYRAVSIQSCNWLLLCDCTWSCVCVLPGVILLIFVTTTIYYRVHLLCLWPTLRYLHISILYFYTFQRDWKLECCIPLPRPNSPLIRNHILIH